jgi:hypothetical protein
MMASDDKKTKADPAPKKEAAAKDKSPSSESASKPEGSEKAGGSEKAAAAPANYSRGEGQKPITAAYKENWNAIFAKKKSKRKKR